MNNKSLLKLISSNINIKQSSTILPSINISNEEYLPIEYVEPTIINADYIISAKLDYNKGDGGKCIYHYPTTIQCNCGNTINLNTIDDSEEILNNDIIISRIGDIKCTNISCKNKLIKPNIILWSYLYPSSVRTTGTNKIALLYCSICKSQNGHVKLGYSALTGKYNKIKSNYFQPANHTNCPKILDNDNLKYNENYILEQVNIVGSK